MTKWNRELIIRDILQRERAGQPLVPGGQDGVPASLYQAATRIFGTWRNAVKASGIAPKQAKLSIRWSRERILSNIQSLARKPTLPRTKEFRRRYAKLGNVARRYFGSWRAALLAAGVDPDQFQATERWSRQRVVEAILKRALAGASLEIRSGSVARAGIRLFGSWSAALRAAGLDPELHREPEPRCTAEGTETPVRLTASTEAPVTTTI